MKVILTLTEEQAHVLNRALDFYSRIQMGQFHEIRRMFNNHGSEDNVDFLLFSARNELIPGLKALGPNAYNGIFSPEVDDSARACFDIIQAVRYKLAWKHEPKGGIQVDFDEPMHMSKMPMPIVELEDD